MKKYIILIIAFYFGFLFSQNHIHKSSEKQMADSTNHTMHSTMHNMKNMGPDNHINRHGSGTAWLPNNSPMYGFMIDSGKWMFMIHGNIFLRYNNQDIAKQGIRGDSKFDAPNWFMIMGRNNLSENDKINLSLMLSLDRLTIGGYGYPLLFQSGETWEGKTLVDRQHPHDLFSELSIEYTHSFRNDIEISGYFGYPGEPALGPVAFMHRASALNNPDAPLSHHWQDATHITFGVGTIGLQIKDYKIEGSIFTGREPNENRYNFDKPFFDSYSVRFSANPIDEIAMQISHGFIKSPESLYPNENIRRTTASIIHNKNFFGENILSTSLVWGFNDVLNGHKENSILFESNYKINKTNIYGRFEWVQKSAEELNTENLSRDKVYNIDALTLGINYQLLTFANTNLIFGTQGSIFKPADELAAFYGKNPLALEVYFKIFPTLMMH